MTLLELGGAVLTALGLMGCGGGSLAHGGVDGGPNGPKTNGTLDAGHIDEGPFSAAQVEAALATCNDAHGPAYMVANGNDVEALAEGAWVPCPGGPSLPSVFSPGMILAPGGKWTRLASDGDGGLAASNGVQNQGQWSAYCETSSSISNDQPCINGSTSNVLVGIQDIASDATGCFNGAISFEVSPRRMYVAAFPGYCRPQLVPSTLGLWLVPL
jgi:hypothetical protein